MPIALICGNLDQLASKEDFKMLRDELISQGSCLFYNEYQLGHIGLLMPPVNIKGHFFEILALIRTCNPEFKCKTTYDF